MINRYWLGLCLVALLYGVLLIVMTGCAAEHPLPPIPVGTCTRDAHLPHPPIPQQRSVAVIIKWANTAASVANKAIIERDLCAGSYDRLHAWGEAVSKR